MDISLDELARLLLTFLVIIVVLAALGFAAGYLMNSVVWSVMP